MLGFVPFFPRPVYHSMYYLCNHYHEANGIFCCLPDFVARELDMMLTFCCLFPNIMSSLSRQRRSSAWSSTSLTWTNASWINGDLVLGRGEIKGSGSFLPTEGDTITGEQLTWPLFVVARSRRKQGVRCATPNLYRNSFIGVMGEKVNKITRLEMGIPSE